MDALKRFVKGDEGQTMVEYSLIGALVSIVAIAALLILGPKVAGVFQNISDELPAAPAA